jgi:hypothetical protein
LSASSLLPEKVNEQSSFTAGFLLLYVRIMTDLFNGSLEMAGALLLLRNCHLLYQHKRVQGVSVATTAFFSVWGIWNLYFYPANGLWLSFAGGVCLATSNMTWVALALYYSRRPPMDERSVPQDLHYFRIPRPKDPRGAMIAENSTME